MRKILLIEPVFAHYRKDYYSCLQENTFFEIHFLAGENYQGIRSLQGANLKALTYFKLNILGRCFYYLKKSIRYINSLKPDIIICSGIDFHLLHTLFIYIIFHLILRKDFYWWSHGTSGKQGYFGKLLRMPFYKLSNGIFVYTDKGKENLISMGIKPQNIQVIKNALNRKDYGFLNYDITKVNKETHKFNILFCGRITAQKKLDVLFLAIHIVKTKFGDEINCTIVGGGNIDYYRVKAIELGIDKTIKFAGEKYGNDVAPFYLNADLFVYPGGIGLSIVQALSYGLPVITTDNHKLHGPEVELLINGVNGAFFKDNNASDLADKIVEWKEKIMASQNEIKNRCIQTIQDMEYLPELVSNKKLTFLKNRYYQSPN